MNDITGSIIGLLIRLTLTVLLLVQVWTHSHWSVALTLTLMTVANEMANVYLLKILKTMESETLV